MPELQQLPGRLEPEAAIGSGEERDAGPSWHVTPLLSLQCLEGGNGGGQMPEAETLIC